MIGSKLRRLNPATRIQHLYYCVSLYRPKTMFQNTKTFRPKRVFGRKTKLQARLSASFGAVDVRASVRCPPGEDKDEWLAVNCVDFFNQTNVIFGNLMDVCTKETCPIMCAGPKYTYRWADGEKVKKPIKCSASEYIHFLMNWIQEKLDDPVIFPMRTDVSFGPTFLPTMKQIFKRLFRVYGHIYYHHFKHLENIGADKFLNMSFKHFVFFTEEYELIEAVELKPLVLLIDTFHEKEREYYETLKKQSVSDEGTLSPQSSPDGKSHLMQLFHDPNQPSPAESEEFTVLPGSLRNSPESPVIPELEKFKPRAAILGVGWEADMQCDVLRVAGYDITTAWSDGPSFVVHNWADKHQIEHVASSLSAVLNDESLDLIYVTSALTKPSTLEELIRQAGLSSLRSVIFSPTSLAPLQDSPVWLSVAKNDALEIFPTRLSTPNFRMLPTVQKLRESVSDEKKCGQVLHLDLTIQCNWRLVIETTQEQGDTELYVEDAMNFVIMSLLDTVTFILGDAKIRRLSGVFRSLAPPEHAKLPAADFALVHFETKSKVAGSITVSFVNNFATHKFDVMVTGKEGQLRLLDDQLFLTTRDSKDFKKRSSILINDQSNLTKTGMPYATLSHGSLHYFDTLKAHSYVQKYGDNGSLSNEMKERVQKLSDNALSLSGSQEIIRLMSTLRNHNSVPPKKLKDSVPPRASKSEPTTRRTSLANKEPLDDPVPPPPITADFDPLKSFYAESGQISPTIQRRIRTPPRPQKKHLKMMENETDSLASSGASTTVLATNTITTTDLLTSVSKKLSEWR